MLPLLPLLAPLILPVANKVIDTLGGLAKNTLNVAVPNATSSLNTPTSNNKIIF